MKELSNILYGVRLEAVSGDTKIGVRSLAFDSRKVQEGGCFVAIKGLQVDGHDFIDKAIGSGATSIICEKIPEPTKEGITYIQVQDAQMALAIMASNFYDNPSRNIKLVGITGTNGKTTVATLLYRLFKKAGYKVGLISTIKIMIDDQEQATSHTTPDSLTINKNLALMSEQGIEYCFMEVSSHGIAQKRTHGLRFEGAVFTNLSHDHLDYHGTYSNYIHTKKILFDQLNRSAFALVNRDDKNGEVMLQNTIARQYTYALKSFSDYKGQILEQQLDGQLLKFDENEIWSKLIGGFNAYNLLAIYGTAHLLGLDRLEALTLMSELDNVDGRFQYYVSKEKITAIVDYAHTPDALMNVLNTINTLRTGNESVITVVGCGGDRDKSKRPVMGHIASQMSNQAIFTSDNPRTEPPAQIIAEMEEGVEPQNVKKVISIENRRMAIKTACKLAIANDIILVAGKGHETYQETNGKRTEFDDFKEVKTALAEIDK